MLALPEHRLTGGNEAYGLANTVHQITLPVSELCTVYQKRLYEVALRCHDQNRPDRGPIVFFF